MAFAHCVDSHAHLTHYFLGSMYILSYILAYSYAFFFVFVLILSIGLPCT
jgi:hypothetical protein